jgi:hypothetical protein
MFLPSKHYSHDIETSSHPLGANLSIGKRLSYHRHEKNADEKLMYAILGGRYNRNTFRQYIFNPTWTGNQGYRLIVISFGNVIRKE